MLDSYNITNQAVTAGETLVFPTDSVKTPCTVTHTEGTGTFSLSKAGYYYVSFNADVAITDSTAGDIVVELQNSGVAVPAAKATYYCETSGNVGNVGFSKIIKVSPSCCMVDNTAVLTFVNTGVDATYTNANLVILPIN